MSSTGQKLYLLIRERGITQTDLAKLAGVHKSTVNNIVKGRVDNIQAENLEKIARALGVTTGWLLDNAASSLPESEKVLSGREKAILSVHRAIDRLGWEEVAKRVEDWDEDEGIIPAEPIAKPKGRQRIIPAIPIDPPTNLKGREKP